MGSSPIARSIFSPALIFSFLLLPLLTAQASFAQVDPDPSRPFGQGQVLLLPGTNSYVGDLPHSVTVMDELSSFHALSGSLATEVGWFVPGSSVQPGLRNFAPGVLFEGIAFPFPTTQLLSLMPTAGKVDLLDLPSSAWWGPSAAPGAVLLERPSNAASIQDGTTLWGSDAGPWGAQNLFRSKVYSLDGNYQQWTGPFPDGNLGLISRGHWFKTDDLQVESGILAVHSDLGVDWFSALADLKLSSPNFQTLELKPYYQSAQWNGSNAEELGTFLHYSFNMAGLLQAQLGGGVSRENVTGTLGNTQVDKGFGEANCLVDVLGPITFDSALRLDLSSVTADQFSALLGLQAAVDDLTFKGDYAKSVLTLIGDAQQVDVGFSYQPTSELETGLKYIHLMMGGAAQDGGRLEIGIDRTDPFLFPIFRRIKIRLVEQVLQGNGGSALYDTGGQLSWGPFDRVKITFRGRVLSSQAFFSEVGAEYSAIDQLSLFASLSNLNNLPVAWPDSTAPAGRTLQMGLKGQF